MIVCVAIVAVTVVLLGVVKITGSADSIGDVTPWLLVLLGTLTTGADTRRTLP